MDVSPQRDLNTTLSINSTTIESSPLTVSPTQSTSAVAAESSSSSSTVSDSITTTTTIIANSRSASASASAHTSPVTSGSGPSATTLSNPKSSSPAIPSKDIAPTVAIFSAILVLLIAILMFLFVRNRRKRQQQLLTSTVESGIPSDPNTPVSQLTNPPPQSSPLPPPPAPSSRRRPSMSTTNSSSTLSSSERRSYSTSSLPTSLPATTTSAPLPSSPESATTRAPRYHVSTLEIEPMTRRVTINLGDRGRNIVVQDPDGRGTDHVVNVVSIREEDETDDDAGHLGGRLPHGLTKKLLFWR